jgi:quercetin dioxygenase-like cupin family protein
LVAETATPSEVDRNPDETGRNAASTNAPDRARFPNPEVKNMKRILSILLLAAVSLNSAAGESSKDASARATLVYQHELPNVPGKSIKGVLVEYGPGGHSPAHTHAPSAFIYATVLEGAIVSQVNDGPAKTYRAGESFSEMPGDRHLVSANASKTEPARLLAVFVVDTKDEVLTTPMKH